jgi:hypothetical protein
MCPKMKKSLISPNIKRTSQWRGIKNVNKQKPWSPIGESLSKIVTLVPGDVQSCQQHPRALDPAALQADHRQRKERGTHGGQVPILPKVTNICNYGL